MPRTVFPPLTPLYPFFGSFYSFWPIFFRFLDWVHEKFWTENICLIFLCCCQGFFVGFFRIVRFARVPWSNLNFAPPDGIHLFRHKIKFFFYFSGPPFTRPDPRLPNAYTHTFFWFALSQTFDMVNFERILTPPLIQNIWAVGWVGFLRTLLFRPFTNSQKYFVV